MKHQKNSNKYKTNCKNCETIRETNLLISCNLKTNNRHREKNKFTTSASVLILFERARKALHFFSHFISHLF